MDYLNLFDFFNFFLKELNIENINKNLIKLMEIFEKVQQKYDFNLIIIYIDKSVIKDFSSIIKIKNGINFDQNLIEKIYFSLKDEKSDQYKILDPNLNNILNKNGFKFNLVVPIFINNKKSGYFSIIDKRELNYDEKYIYILKGFSLLLSSMFDNYFKDYLLKNHEKMDNLIFGNLDELIFFLDKDLKIKITNKKSSEYFNLKFEEIIGKKCFEIKFNSDTPCKNCPVLKSFKSLKREEGVIRKNNEKAFFVKAIPVLDENNELIGVIETNLDITEKVLFEERFKTVFDQTSIGLTITSIDGKVLLANPARCKMLGYSTEELLGMNFKEYIYEDDLKEDLKNYEKLIKGEIDNYKLDLRVKRKDSSIGWNRIYVSKVLDSNNNFLYSIALVEDITKEKELEEKSAFQEKRLGAIFNQTSVGINVIDTKTKHIECNKTWSEMIGYSVDELKNMSFIDYTYIDDIEKNLELFNNVLIGKIDSYVLEKRFVKKDGTIFWGRINSRAIKDEQGNILYFITVVENIDSEKKYWLKLKESEEKFRAIIEGIPDFILRVKSDGRIIDYKGEVWKFFKNILDLSDKNLFDLFDKNLSDKFKSYIEKSLKEEGIYTIEYSLNLNNIKDNNFFEARIIKISFDEVIIIIRDVTEITRTKLNLIEKDKKLEELLDRTTLAFSKLVEFKEYYTFGHQKRVSKLSELIAKKMGLGQDSISCVKYAGLLHDIGKIEIPIEILNKPRRLTQTEYDLVKLHPVYGYEILKTIDFPWPVAEVIYQHHERIDGSGYPRGLKNGEILIEAKILGVCDVFEALCFNRIYRDKLSLDSILDELNKNKNKLYDEKVVDTLIEILKENNYDLNKIFGD